MIRLKNIHVHLSCRRLLFLAGLFIIMAAANGPAGADVSDLWGSDGKNWMPKSRLPDFSYAGYRGGFRPIPQLPVKVNVRAFGAVGDGKSDDTAAFIKAIAAVNEGAVLIPSGRYKITGVVLIHKRGVVLRGEGIDTTVLFFPRSLTDVVGPGKDHAPGGSWSWSGGLISFEGEEPPLRLANVIASAQRGDTSLIVSTTSILMPGQWVRLVLTNTDGSLARCLYGEKQGSPKEAYAQKLVDFVSPVESIEGNRIILKRALRTEVRLKWKPEVWAHNPSVQDVGIEDLTVEFPSARYAGHHDEPGFNAISFEGVSHGWIRRVRIRNADNGIFLRDRTKFCTVESVQFVSDPGRLRTGYGRDRGEPLETPVGGHHGILIAGAADNIVSDFQMTFRFIHDIGVSAWAAGNVFSNGRGIDMDFDHHRRGPYENLFTEIHVGKGSRLWQAGGDLQDGAPSGVRETFWNIQTDQPQQIPVWSLQGNFVGITTRLPTHRSEDGDWWEAVPPEQLFPANLYAAQKKHLR
jgi:hypothetical protein